MSHSQETINELISKRTARYGQGFTQRDAAAVCKLQSADFVFNDIGMAYKTNHKAFVEFTRSNFASMESLVILEEKTSGTADFTAWEILVQIEAKVDIPELAIEAGHKNIIRGVALQWWKWEGSGNSWDGDLSDEGIEGWKIAREHDYMLTLREDDKGRRVRIFDDF